MIVSPEVASRFGYFNSECFDYSDHHALVIGEKTNGGRTYLDVRKWIQFNNETEPHPSKRGLMLEKSEWNNVIKSVSKYMKNENP